MNPFVHAIGTLMTQDRRSLSDALESAEHLIPDGEEISLGCAGTFSGYLYLQWLFAVVWHQHTSELGIGYMNPDQVFDKYDVHLDEILEVMELAAKEWDKAHEDLEDELAEFVDQI